VYERKSVEERGVRKRKRKKKRVPFFFVLCLFGENARSGHGRASPSSSKFQRLQTRLRVSDIDPAGWIRGGV